MKNFIEISLLITLIRTVKREMVTERNTQYPFKEIIEKFTFKLIVYCLSKRLFE